ncbi:MAG: divalent cation transporter [Thaumarchaeota archaeon]|nr:divalent cation transporter [Nitrososphaerota archaeon]
MAHEQDRGLSGRGSSAGRFRVVASGAAPLALVVVLVLYVSGPGSTMLEVGVPLPEVTIERVDFVGSEILATVRNTGPIPVSIAVADVNDRIHPAAVEPDAHLERYETAVVRIPFDWNVAEPYTIGITTDDGTRFEREVESAAPALRPSGEMAAFFAVIGTYVGVIPVLIGLLWLPFMRRMGRQVYVFFLAVTVGLLFFLALDSVEEAVDVSQENLAGSFNGLMLLATSVVVSFLGLFYAGERLSGSRGIGGGGRVGGGDGRTGSGASPRLAGPVAIALMISIGIGLHNFGEGLAIGAAVGLGSVAFSSFLIVGFAIHNVTEGVAIAAPLSRERVAVWKLAGLGVLAGAPAIFGGWVGGFAYSPIASVVFLGVGAGAIFQVMVVLVRWIGRGDSPANGSNGSGASGGGSSGLSSAPFAAGIVVGMLIMYVTSILV